jgi:endonuclease/exonuclease/phosphatase family metal-dependent hydrolase
MSKFLTIFLLLALTAQAQETVTVMTFNIRYATPNDGENQWEYRKQHVAETIEFYKADICGLQEATEPQVLYLARNLNAYKWIGVGRDDGISGGEFSPIFYTPKSLELLNWETIWLSKTPEKPSKDWDAALPRIATIAYFKRLADGKEFAAVNTHYDHMGKVARVESSKLILEKVNNLVAEGIKVILLGDFNSTPIDLPMTTFTNGSLKNSFDLSSSGHFGPINSFTGFLLNEKEDSQIDHIFVTKGIRVTNHATISQTWNGKFASDHHAIVAKLKF